MRPEVARAFRAVGHGTLPSSYGFERWTLQTVGQRCQPSGDLTRSQGEPGSRRSFESKPFFGATLAVLP